MVTSKSSSSSRWREAAASEGRLLLQGWRRKVGQASSCLFLSAHVSNRGSLGSSSCLGLLLQPKMGQAHGERLAGGPWRCCCPPCPLLDGHPTSHPPGMSSWPSSSSLGLVGGKAEEEEDSQSLELGERQLGNHHETMQTSFSHGQGIFEDLDAAPPSGEDALNAGSI